MSFLAWTHPLWQHLTGLSNKSSTIRLQGVDGALVNHRETKFGFVTRSTDVI